MVLNTGDDGKVGPPQASFQCFRRHAIGFDSQGPTRQDSIGAGTAADAIIYLAQRDAGRQVIDMQELQQPFRPCAAWL